MYMLEALKLESYSLRRTIDGLKKENSNLEAELTKAKKLTEIYRSLGVDLYEERDRLREVVDALEKEINTLKKKIHELEEENANLRVTPTDASAIEVLEKANSALRRDNEILWAKLEEVELNSAKRPWHGDANAMTGTWTCCESLSEELKEKVDLSYDHKFEFGDKVWVSWSDAPYMYIHPGRLYNPRTDKVVYVGKTQHLKWFGERFEIK